MFRFISRSRQGFIGRSRQMYTNANNAKAQIDYILMNKKWIDNALNCEAYSYFDHQIVTANLRLRLRKNVAQTTKTAHYNWSMLNNRDISDKYTITLWNKFDAFQEISETLTPNDEYDMEAAVECIPTKLKAKQSSLGDKTWWHENCTPMQ